MGWDKGDREAPNATHRRGSGQARLQICSCAFPFGMWFLPRPSVVPSLLLTLFLSLLPLPHPPSWGRSVRALGNTQSYRRFAFHICLQTHNSLIPGRMKAPTSTTRHGSETK